MFHENVDCVSLACCKNSDAPNNLENAYRTWNRAYILIIYKHDFASVWVSVLNKMTGWHWDTKGWYYLRDMMPRCFEVLKSKVKFLYMKFQFSRGWRGREVQVLKSRVQFQIWKHPPSPVLDLGHLVSIWGKLAIFDHIHFPCVPASASTLHYRLSLCGD